jgi:hypothetical protein
LLVVIAIAVTAVTAGAAVAALAPSVSGGTILGGLGALAAGTTGLGLGAVAIGAGAAALGSIVSQGIGVATGLQDKFSWKSVALAGISGGVGAGLGGFAPFGSGTGTVTQIANGVARGALGNVVTQGVSVATGLQSKFDWTGVAVGAVVGGVSAGVGGALVKAGLGGPGATNLANGANGLISGVAGAIAGATTRSLITGTDFGDNILAALPDVIGSTIGNLVAGGIAKAPDPNKLSAKRSFDRSNSSVQYASAGGVIGLAGSSIIGDLSGIVRDYVIDPVGKAIGLDTNKDGKIEWNDDIVVTARRNGGLLGWLFGGDSKTVSLSNDADRITMSINAAQSSNKVSGGYSLSTAASPSTQYWANVRGGAISRFNAALGGLVQGFANNPGKFLTDTGYRTGALTGAVAAPFEGAISSALRPAFPDTVDKFGAQIRVRQAATNPFGIDFSPQTKRDLLATAVVGIASGRALTGVVGRGPVVADRGASKFVSQGFSPAQAEYLAEPYAGMGHHFIPRRTGLPSIISDSRFNVLKPNGISRGDFYELHFRVDTKYPGSQLPASRGGGGWYGGQLGIEKYGSVGRLWYGSPAPLKVTVGGTVAAGGAAYWYSSDGK